MRKTMGLESLSVLVFLTVQWLAAGIAEDHADDFMFHGNDNDKTVIAPPSDPGNGTFNSTATVQGATNVDTMGIVKHVFIILAIGVCMSLVLLLFTFLQLRYCKNCWPEGARTSPGGQPAARRGRQRATDTGLVAKANLQGMSKQERLEVINHLFRARITAFAKKGEPHHGLRDIEAGEAACPSFHTVVPKQVEESLHQCDGHDDHIWESNHHCAESHHIDCCSICLSAFRCGQRVLETPCGHCFHHACCQEWIQKRDTCPYCRSDLYSPEELREAAIDVLGQERVDQLGCKDDGDPDKPQNGSFVTAASAVASEGIDAEAEESATGGVEQLPDNASLQPAFFSTLSAPVASTAGRGDEAR
jgi:hypothetical protein